MRALELNNGQEIRTLQKAVENRLERLEELIKFDGQGQRVQRQNLDSSVHKKPLGKLHQSSVCLPSNNIRKSIWPQVP